MSAARRSLIAALVTCAVAAALLTAHYACGGGQVTEAPTPQPTAATAVPTAAPAPTPEPTPTPAARAAEFPPVSLPADDGPHDVSTEWWYFNGHLSSGGPEPLIAFHFVIFKIAAPQIGGTGLMGHLTLTDLATGEHTFEERLSLYIPAEEGGFSIDMLEWSMSGAGGDFSIAAGMGDTRFDLRLTALKPAVIHPGPEGDGLVYYSPQDVSYYYSYTRLAAEGTLTIDGNEAAASGTVWMDHQWGDFEIDPAGWDWFSLHLDDGTELMLATVRGDEIVKSGLGTFVDREGSATAVTAEVTPLDQWTSEATGGTYPIGWTVFVPEIGVSLTLEPVTPAAEVDPETQNVPTYWEGPIRAAGTRDGRALSGTGFAELVGYSVTY